MKHALALFAGLGLMACAPTEKPESPAAEPVASAPAEPAPPAATPANPTTPPPQPGDDACNKAKYAGLIGQPIGTAGVPAESAGVRWIRPNTQVTMDYRPDRLNIYINADGVITELRCT